MRGPTYLAGVAALLTFTVLVTMAGDGKDGFWVNHPMFGALLSGAILFLFGAFVVQRFIDHRAAQRWSVIAGVGYWALGVEVRDTLATLWGVHSSRDTGGGVWLEKGLTPARELKNDLPGAENVRALADPRLPAEDLHGGEVLPRARLRALLADPEWVSFALGHAIARNDVLRSGLREWATLMISADEPRDMVNDYAAYVREVARVVRALQQVGFALASGDDASAGRWTNAALHRWQVTDIKGRLLVNALWSKAGSSYAFAVPEPLQKLSSREAMRTPGSLGSAWTPSEADVTDGAL